MIGSFGFRVDLPPSPVLEEKDVPDLTTLPARAAGTVAADALHIAPPKDFWTKLGAPVPGRLVSGTLPDDHHARFLLRLPRDWNGRLVVAAASGITDENTYDLYFSDVLLSRGYAFAATDKGVRRCVLDGTTVLMPMIPEASLARWASRLEALAAHARALAAKIRGRAPDKTYAVGLSNGGFVARRAAESASGLFDGALEISGVLWRAGRGNLLRELPAALRATKREPWDRAALEALGYAAGGKWDPVLAQYRAAYWEASLGIFLADLDPEYRGPLEDYDLDLRPAAVRARLEELQNTGDLKVPLISLAGERDYLISCAGHARAYEALVRSRGKAALHRANYFPESSHIDANRESFPFVEPLMPRAHAAFDELVAWVEKAPATLHE
ncbi:MAG TPA: tannase/feruloyl esterase family alpha/beta hydrolase [Elusimicrobiota bacterium]|nr:tannase/feruloyl esterase family alpha/beta hydrolase [Elusimicrobiota bacterium]